MAEPFLGEIRIVGFNFAPRGWAAADGQLLPIAQNTALFSLYGTVYGGDGRTTFALPDVRSRVPMHTGTGSGLTTRPLGSRGGSETTVLTVNELPSHNHTATLKGTKETADQTHPDGAILAVDAGTAAVYHKTAAADKNMRADAIAVSNSGGNRDFSLMNPFITLNYVVATQGLFPSRS